MAIETLDDIVDELMDQLGVYGAHHEAPEIYRGGDKWTKCQCRCCSETDLKSRIRAAVEVERRLSS